MIYCRFPFASNQLPYSVHFPFAVETGNRKTLGNRIAVTGKQLLGSTETKV